MEKILKIQTEIGSIIKDNKVSFGTTKYKYFDINQLLEKLLPLLEKHKLTVIQPLSNIDGKPALKTIVFDAEYKRFTGTMKGEDVLETHPSVIISEIIPLPDLQDPQKMGSAITYYRRYALQSLFLLQAEDDDGLSAKPTSPTGATQEPKDQFIKSLNQTEEI